MMEEKAFPTGAVLSVVTGCLVSENHMDGIYEVLSFMSGESVYTHQIPRVSKEATAVLLAIHPELSKAIDEADFVTTENWKEWLARWKARYGEEIIVPVMLGGEHKSIDPVAELVEMVGKRDDID